jgi:hypothetical protein
MRWLSPVRSTCVVRQRCNGQTFHKDIPLITGKADQPAMQRGRVGTRPTPI